MNKAKLIVAGASIPLLLLLMTQCVTCVSPGHVGVQKVFGEVYPDTLTEGIHVIAPYMSIEDYSVQTRLASIATESSSKDLQEVQTILDVNYAIIAGSVPTLRRKVGTVKDVETKILSPAVKEVCKAVMAEHSAADLIQRRSEVALRIVSTIQSRIDTVHEGVVIENVSLANFSFSKEFTTAVEAKQRAEQDAQRAENEKLKRITEAQAKQAEVQLASDAEAYAIEKRSHAEASSIQRIGEALRQNPSMIQLKATERWNGQLPTYVGGDGPYPMLGVK